MIKVQNETWRCRGSATCMQHPPCCLLVRNSCMLICEKYCANLLSTGWTSCKAHAQAAAHALRLSCMGPQLHTSFTGAIRMTHMNTKTLHCNMDYSHYKYISVFNFCQSCPAVLHSTKTTETLSSCRSHVRCSDQSRLTAVVPLELSWLAVFTWPLELSWHNNPWTGIVMPCKCHAGGCAMQLPLGRRTLARCSTWAGMTAVFSCFLGRVGSYAVTI